MTALFLFAIDNEPELLGIYLDVPASATSRLLLIVKKKVAAKSQIKAESVWVGRMDNFKDKLRWFASFFWCFACGRWAQHVCGSFKSHPRPRCCFFFERIMIYMSALFEERDVSWKVASNHDCCRSGRK